MTTCAEVGLVVIAGRGSKVDVGNIFQCVLAFLANVLN